MNAETIIKENTRFDRGGRPLEVVIPYKQFIDFIEEHGLDQKAVEQKEPNQETQEAMKQSLNGLPEQSRFSNVADLMADLES